MGLESWWCHFWLQPTLKLEEKPLTSGVMALLAVEISLCAWDSLFLHIVRSCLPATRGFQNSELKRLNNRITGIYMRMSTTGHFKWDYSPLCLAQHPRCQFCSGSAIWILTHSGLKPLFSNPPESRHGWSLYSRPALQRGLGAGARRQRVSTAESPFCASISPFFFYVTTWGAAVTPSAGRSLAGLADACTRA